jgi:hypothetical protein
LHERRAGVSGEGVMRNDAPRTVQQKTAATE